MAEPALVLAGVERRFAMRGAPPVEVLRGCDLTVAPGELVALVGPSGAGKSTLLHVAGLLERPSGGEVIVAGQATNRLSEAGRTALRLSTIGFVYQFHNLLPEFLAWENVALPVRMAGATRGGARERAEGLLARVGLSHRLGHRPATLSGGEQQRVAIARALANGPALLLADEPTGNLDEGTADEVFALLAELVRGGAGGPPMAALIATHNLALGRRMDRAVTLVQGRIAATSL